MVVIRTYGIENGLTERPLADLAGDPLALDSLERVNTVEAVD
jgi:hypothetical protein